jgi:hypothetical protein
MSKKDLLTSSRRRRDPPSTTPRYKASRSIEQVVEEALQLADTVVVMESGRIATSGPVSDFDDAAVVRDVYIGRR